MTTYGTISSEESNHHQLEASSSNQLFLSRTKHLIQTCVGTPRPWKDILQNSRHTFPPSFSVSVRRLKSNARALRANYVVVLLLVLLLTLLWHPLCVIVSCVMMGAWGVLYFVRDSPLRACGYEVDERLVVMTLLLVTVGMVFLSSVTENILGGVCVGVGIVVVHGVMREADEDDRDEEMEGEEGGMGRDNNGREVFKVPMRHAASSSFSMS